LRQNPALWTRRYTTGLFVTLTGARLLNEPLSGINTPPGTGTQARVPRENQTSAVMEACLV
jgi:hypothetical protein